MSSFSKEQESVVNDLVEDNMDEKISEKSIIREISKTVDGGESKKSDEHYINGISNSPSYIVTNIPKSRRWYKILISCLIVLYFIILIPLMGVTLLIRLFSVRRSIAFASRLCYFGWILSEKLFLETVEVEINNEGPRTGRQMKLANCAMPCSLMVSNHLASSDFLITNYLANGITCTTDTPITNNIRNPRFMAHCKYTFKDSLKFVPIFYQICSLANMLVLCRNYNKDAKHIRKVIRECIMLSIPYCFVIFPEGTRFTEKKHAESIKYCRKEGLTEMNNILYPRVKGYLEMASEIADRGNSLPEIRDDTVEETFTPSSLIDLTIWYKNTTPSGLDFIIGNKAYKLRIHREFYYLDEESKRREFLVELFTKKDRMIGRWKDESMHN